LTIYHVYLDVPTADDAHDHDHEDDDDDNDDDDDAHNDDDDDHDDDDDNDDNDDNDYDYDDDYILDVLMGFLGEDVPQSVLPLMINFEAKSITTKFDLLKANMQNRSPTD
jgi:hypothetical protein